MGADKVGNGADIFANCRRGAPSADSIQATPQGLVIDNGLRTEINVMKTMEYLYKTDILDQDKEKQA